MNIEILQNGDIIKICLKANLPFPNTMRNSVVKAASAVVAVAEGGI